MIMMKKVIFGLIIGLMLGVSTNAFAAVGDKIEAVFAQFGLVVNGESRVLEADYLVYQDSTYVPLRAITNLLGYDVTYKSDSRTIGLDKTEVSILEDTNAVLTTEVSNVPIAETGWTLENLELSINSYKDYIVIYERQIAYYEEKGRTKIVEGFKLSLAESKAKLAELEAKKAELLAQP